MTLLKINDFDPDYLDSFGGDDIKGRDLYTQGSAEKIGTVNDILVDEDSGEFRYLLINLGTGLVGKKVLLPVGRSRMNSSDHRVYTSLTKEQAERLPELEEETTVDYDYEEQVRGVYRTQSLDNSAALDSPVPLDATVAATSYEAPTAAYDRDMYTYQQEPELYGMNEQDHQTLKLYEERLVTGKQRRKTGEVTIGKHVETETARVSVPLEKERVVIERVTPADAGRAVAPGQAAFQGGEVAHMEIYEETPDIRKEAVLREEVRVSKEVEHETVEAQETIRREELDIDTEGRPVIDRSGLPGQDRV